MMGKHFVEQPMKYLENEKNACDFGRLKFLGVIALLENLHTRPLILFKEN